MKIRCRVGFHNWSLWSEPFQCEFSRLTGYSTETEVYVALAQDRRCQDCRLAQIKKKEVQ